MIKSLSHLNSTFYPAASRDLKQSDTLHPVNSSGVVQAADSPHAPKKIHEAAAAIGFPALGNSDMNSAMLLDSLARAEQQGLGANSMANAAQPKAGIFGVYSAMGQLTPTPSERGSLVDIVV